MSDRFIVTRRRAFAAEAIHLEAIGEGADDELTAFNRQQAKALIFHALFPC